MQAFQAWNAGSIPAARTKDFHRSESRGWKFIVTAQRNDAGQTEIGRAPELESRGRL